MGFATPVRLQEKVFRVNPVISSGGPQGSVINIPGIGDIETDVSPGERHRDGCRFQRNMMMIFFLMASSIKSSVFSMVYSANVRKTEQK